MHTHTSAVTAVQVFLMVLIMGTFWRIGAGYAARRPGIVGELGKAAAVQF
jgi:hypothetical protein